MPSSASRSLSGDDVRAAAVALHAKRNDRGMLQEEEQIGNPVRAAILDELPLEGECLVVRHHAETADFELAHHWSQRSDGDNGSTRSNGGTENI